MIGLLASNVPYFPLNDIARRPVWISAVFVLGVFIFLVLTVLLAIWGERRIIGRMQQRPGPNRVGPFGLLQPLADGIKLGLKESLIPTLVDKPIYLLAPIISAVPAFLAYSVLPFGGVVSIAGHRTALQITDLPVAVLFILACSSFGVYGIVLAGWSSASPYPLLGGLRSAAQVISYEIAMGLALVPVFLKSGSLSTSEIVAAQNQGHWTGWYFLPLFPSMIIYAIAAVGETNRAPFDLPEAEGELVGGFHTEYSSLKFATFFLAEYVNMATVSGLAATMFLGGWRPPPIPVIAGLTGWWGILWFIIKVYAIMFVFMWLRGTLPRFRYDQFMRFGWTRLVPLALLWLLIVGSLQLAQGIGGASRREILTYLVASIAVLIIMWFVYEGRLEKRRDAVAAEIEELGGIDTTGTFPLPDLDALRAERAPSPAVLAGQPRAVTVGARAESLAPGRTIDAEEPADRPAERPEDADRG